MSITQYKLSWDSHRSNVCDGFANLQQNEEFVDMTLAADGHLVKVHKSIFALASPYIKSMIQSTTNEHPIIFLGNVSHEVLNYILTYIYTGEVSVEVDKIQSFMKVAKDLQLSGLFGLAIPNVGSKENKESFNTDSKEHQFEDDAITDIENSVQEMTTDNANLIDKFSGTESVVTHREILDMTVFDSEKNESSVKSIDNPHKLSSEIRNHENTDFKTKEELQNNRDNGLYVTADGYQFKLEIQQPYNKHPDSTSIIVENTSDTPSEMMQVANSMNTVDTKNNQTNGNFASFEDEFRKTISNTLHLGPLDPKALTPQYTISSRGSLQLILNRYMYYCHHQSHGGRKRRWRCIDYRSKHCPAFIDTDNEIMTSRKFGHAHSFHDEKIRKKMKRDLIFTNLNILLQKSNASKKNSGTN